MECSVFLFGVILYSLLLWHKSVTEVKMQCNKHTVAMRNDGFITDIIKSKLMFNWHDVSKFSAFTNKSTFQISSHGGWLPYVGDWRL